VTRSSVTPILRAFKLYVYTRALMFPLISSAYVYHHNNINKETAYAYHKTF